MKHLFSASCAVLFLILSVASVSAAPDDQGAQPWDPPAEDPVHEKKTKSKSTNSDPSAEEGDSKTTSLKSRMSKAKLKEEIESYRAAEYRDLPGGVFRAPKIYKQLKDVIKNFQNTGMVDKDAVFNVFLASTPEINAWVRQVHQIQDLKVFHIVVTKGLIDLVSNPEHFGVPVEKSHVMSADSLGLLASILGHELGHAMNGDNSKTTTTNRMYNELAADEFAVRVTAKAGYDPEAMVKMLELFEYMHDDKSLRAMLSTMLDEHPKPRFRIANISDLVTTLKDGKAARESLGFDASSIPDPVRGQVDHTGVERTSKSSLEGVLKNLGTEDYRNKDLRGKLSYIEQYLAVSRTKADGMLRQSYVVLVREYQSLLTQMRDLESVEQLIISLGRFEKGLGNAATITGSKDKENVKKAFADLKNEITKKQISLLEEKVAAGMTLESLKKYSPQIDRRVLFGFLMRQASKATTTEQLTQILRAQNDNDFFSKERFQRHNTSRSANFRAYSARIYEAMAVRVLHLTKNLETTLDFMQENFPVRQNGEKSYIEGFHYIFGGLSHYIMTHSEIDFGKFHQRIDHPKTAKDRLYAAWIAANGDEVSAIMYERRGIAADLQPMSATFRYGMGRRYHQNGVPSEDHVVYLSRVLNKKALESIFNELIQSHYTLDQALALLEKRTRGNASEWKTIRAEMAKIIAGKNTHRDLHTNLYMIEDYVAVAHPELLSTVKGDLANAAAEAKTILKENTIALLGAFANARPYKRGNAEVYVSTPIPTEKSLAVLPAAEKAEFFDILLRTEVSNIVRRNADKFQLATKVVVEALTELVKEGKIPEQAKIEFLDAMTEFAKIAVDFKEARIHELPPRYFELRRELRLMDYILGNSTAKWQAKLPFKESAILGRLFDTGAGRFSAPSQAQAIINNFLIADKNAVVKYLQDPVANEGQVTKQFHLVSALAKTVSLYEGLGNVGNAEELSGVLITSTLAAKVHEPGESRVIIKDTFFENPKLNAEQILSEREKIALLPLSDGFKQILVLETERVHSNVLANALHHTVSADLWAFHLQRAVLSNNAVEALVFTLSYMHDITKNTGVNEERTRLFHTLLTRSLELVSSKAEMELYTSVLAVHLKGHSVGVLNIAELLNADLKKLMDLTSAKYREHFYDRFAQRLDQYDAWEGQKGNGKVRINKLLTAVVKRIHAKAGQYKYGVPLLVRIPKIGGALNEFLTTSKWYQKMLDRVQARLARTYTSLLLKRGLDVGRISTEALLSNIRDNTPWAKVIDEAIARYVKNAKFESKPRTARSERKEALKLVTKIRSLDLRTQAYRDLLKTYDEPKMGMREKMRAYWDLYKAFKAAEQIWTRAVLEELKQAQSMLDAWKLSEKAWDDHVSKRASKHGVGKAEAYILLKGLYDANLRVESPYASEVAGVFPEASRHRDEFLEQWAKKRPMNNEQLKMLDSFKSRNSESPYHKIAKGMFELVDEYVTKLNPLERAHVALYLSGFDTELPKELDVKVRDMFYGSENRRKALKQRGFHFKLSDIKIFFKETHVEERTGAFRALFIGDGGIAGNEPAEALLIDRLLMADQEMPKYLRKVLNIYLTTVSATERSLLLSYLLANGDQGALKGPEVVKLLVEKGGVAAAKLAQVIASHGFKLPKEYQEILEQFKGDAQHVDKMIAMKWIAERLTPEQYKQIKTLDRELGSGSLKVAYAATLKDGRRVVIKLARDQVYYQTAREFELLRLVLEKVMLDPELSIDNLPGIEKEVERIIREELNFKEEFKKMQRHKKAYNSRPVLVKLFGSGVSVRFPQPLEGWQGEGILVEEFVEAKGWNDLPKKGIFGWTKQGLAKAAINEVLNQMMAYMNPAELPADGQIILDIDPHEENQLAKKRGVFTGKQMVDIDLGQSVLVSPEVMRGFGTMIFGVYKGDLEGVINVARKYMVFRSATEVELFRTELHKQTKLSSDPIEVLTKTMEETELAGVMLKPEYLFFQKLFATLVGLKRHVSDPNYLTNQTKKLIVLRGLSNPGLGLEELKRCKAALTEKNFDADAF